MALYRNVTDRGVKKPLDITGHIQNKMLKKNIGDLRRLGADISNSRFKDMDIGSDKVMQQYIKELVTFLESYDFSRLDQRLANVQFSAALNIAKEMDEKAKELGINPISKLLGDIIKDVKKRDDSTARQELSLINKKRNAILVKLGRNKI